MSDPVYLAALLRTIGLDTAPGIGAIVTVTLPASRAVSRDSQV